MNSNLTKMIKEITPGNSLLLPAWDKKAAQSMRSLAAYVSRVFPRHDEKKLSCKWRKEEHIVEIFYKV